MQVEGRIAGDEASRLHAWQPAEVLAVPSTNEVRFSRGFLQASIEPWFGKLPEYWTPLFHSIGGTFQQLSVTTMLEFPEDLEHRMAVEIDGEPGVVALGADSRSLLAQMVVPSVKGKGEEVIAEYLLRRFLSSISTSWTGNGSLACFFTGNASREAIEVVGVVQLRALVADRPWTMYVGLGPRVVDRLDLQWRELICQEELAGNRLGSVVSGLPLEDLNLVSIDLIELAVPPARLLEYVRPGTLVNLEVPVNETAMIRVNGVPAAVAEVVQCNGRFAARVTEVGGAFYQPSAAVTGVQRVRIQLAETELDREGIIELMQPGAVLVTRTALSPRASLVISGERIGDTVVGQIDGQFALNILPK